MFKIKSFVLAATIGVVASVGHPAGPAVEEGIAPPPRPPVYVVEYDVGPAYLPGRPFAEQPGIMEHAGYMEQLSAEGTLVLGGPLFADLEAFVVSGALLFLAAESEAQARHIAEIDPAVTSGFMIITGVKPMMVMIGDL